MNRIKDSVKRYDSKEIFMNKPFGGAFPIQRYDSLINHCSTMHCCGNKLASHDIFPNTVESPSFEPHFFIDIGQFLMSSHACGGVIATAN